VILAALNGMKDISAYIDRSMVTAKRWIDREGLPATKIGGAWISDTELIDEWRNRRIVEQCKMANAGRW
jgi:hypothetical protein